MTGLLACVLVAVAVTASAQTSAQAGRRQQANQPYRGLFGAGTPARPGGHALDLMLSVYEEYGNEFDTPVSGADYELDDIYDLVGIVRKVNEKNR